jgi:hypothetical protein
MLLWAASAIGVYVLYRLIRWFISPVLTYYGERQRAAPLSFSFVDPARSNAATAFAPAISTPPSLYISLIVPAYNEEVRLPVMMDETISYLQLRS